MRNVLSVFIGSPSDLEMERNTAFQVVDEVNESLKESDWYIDLLGWEDTLPGFGRPQALINRDVERCDLFIGLLWRNWGTPPGHDSKFSSGFEEEFSIAKSRREQGSTPEIWMFFKTVEPAQIADAGAQLRNVLAFRDSLIKGKSVLFKEFGAPDWERLLRKTLTRYAFSIANCKSAAPEGPSEGGGQPIKSSPIEVNTLVGRAAGDQLAALSNSLSLAFETGDLGQITKSLSDSDELAFLAVRSLLLSAALVAESRRSETALPIHELNTLYSYRTRLKATDDELYVIFKSLLGDDIDRKPGWFWFKDYETNRIVNRLVAVTLLDDDATARSRSFEILRRSRVSIFAMIPEPLLGRALAELPPELHNIAWAYLVDVAALEDLALLRRQAEGAWFGTRLEWLQAWIASGRELGSFLLKGPNPDLIPTSMKESILAEIHQLKQPSLQALRSMAIPELREAATGELRSRGVQISEDEHKPEAKGYASTLAKLLGGEKEPEENEKYEILNREATETLRNTLDWFSNDGAVRYQLLVERGEIPRETVRMDLSTKFQRVFAESVQRMDEMIGADYATTISQGWEDLREFITGKYTAGALTALAKQPTVEDVPIARQFLDDGHLRTAALRIVAAKGTPKDVTHLIEIAQTTYGYERKLAIEGVLTLTDDALRIAKTLIASENRQLRRAALPLIKSLENREAVQLLVELLSNEDEDLRIGAVGQLRTTLDKDGLDEILRNYVDQANYYYDVVTWLDRVLYAPGPVSIYFESELYSKLERLRDQ